MNDLYKLTNITLTATIINNQRRMEKSVFSNKVHEDHDNNLFIVFH